MQLRRLGFDFSRRRVRPLRQRPRFLRFGSLPPSKKLRDPTQGVAPRAAPWSLGVGLVLLICGCADDGGRQQMSGTTETDGETTGDALQLSISVQEGIEGGVVLSGHSHDAGMTMVGGRLSTASGVEPGGPGVVYWLDGDRLCRHVGVADRTLWWIDGTGDGSWFAVGERGTVLRYDGDTVHDESVQSEAIFYGVRPTEPVIAVGGNPFGDDNGEIWQRGDDGVWSVLHENLEGVAFKIHEDWIVGNGVAWQLRADGTLVPHFPPADARLLTVRKRGEDDVWAVGGSAQAVVLHWDGAAWTEIPFNPACGNGGLNGVTTDGGDVWVGGFFGAMARYDGTVWSCNIPAVTLEHLHATWRHDGEQWWGGGELLASGGSNATLARTGSDPLALPVIDCER